jgi:Na+/H+-translocating membrane pyrophosphatase
VIDTKYRFFTAIAFIVGALTSLVSGYIGMYVATRANVRVTYLAATVKNNPERPDEKLNLLNAFNAAFQGGCTMGFCLVSLALSILTFLIMIYMGKFFSL